MEGWVGLSTTTVSKQSVQDRYVKAINVLAAQVVTHHWTTGAQGCVELTSSRSASRNANHWATESAYICYVKTKWWRTDSGRTDTGINSLYCCRTDVYYYIIKMSPSSFSVCLSLFRLSVCRVRLRCVKTAERMISCSGCRLSGNEGTCRESRITNGEWEKKWGKFCQLLLVYSKYKNIAGIQCGLRQGTLATCCITSRGHTLQKVDETTSLARDTQASSAIIARQCCGTTHIYRQCCWWVSVHCIGRVNLTDADYCDRWSLRLSVCHARGLCKICWTDKRPVWVGDFPTTHCIRWALVEYWSSYGKGKEMRERYRNVADIRCGLRHITLASYFDVNH